MDLLVALGTSAAWGLSVWDYFTAGPLYFESSVAIITLVRLGKYMEGRVKRDAARAITALQGCARRSRTGRMARMCLWPLVPGDEIELRPGERVPVDGIVLKARAASMKAP